MVGKLLLQSRLLPLESVSLGRFVVDIAFPQRRFHDPLLEQPPQSTRYKQRDFHELTGRYKSTNAGTRLTELLVFFRGVEGSLESHVSATASITLELCQWDAVFKEACALPVTRKWIEEAIEDDQSIYFIVGFRTFVDPTASESMSKASTKGGEVQLPASLIAEANVPGLALGGALDPAVTGSKTTAEQNTRSFGAPGEMVYAVQYCKVNFKWYSSRKVETGSLGRTRWKLHWGVRTSDETEEDDVLEADLDEDIGVESQLSNLVVLE
jgi:hypothetical protein